MSYTTLRKLHVLEKGVTVETLPASEENKCTILDDQALVQAIGKPKSARTFVDYAQMFSSTCLSYLKKPCPRVDVVFDRYDPFEKDQTVKRPVRLIVNDVPLPSNGEQFII